MLNEIVLSLCAERAHHIAKIMPAPMAAYKITVANGLRRYPVSALYPRVNAIIDTTVDTMSNTGGITLRRMLVIGFSLI